MTERYAAMIKMLKDQDNLVITGHVDPDGDCLGAVLALLHAFGTADKHWTAVLHDRPSANYDFLPGIERIISVEELDYQPQAVLLVDCSETERAGGRWLDELSQTATFYCIDHHISSNFHGKLAVIEPEASSSGEVVGAIIEEAGIQLTPEIARNLYTAIVADTGCFRYQNTTPRSLILAAKLLPLVDLEEIRMRLFENRSRENMRMMQVCLEHMTYAADGDICYSYIDRDSLAKYGATTDDCRNIVNYTLMTKGVRMSALFEEHPDYVKISFRSRMGRRVDLLAEHFGGGGHKLASGCRVKGALPGVIDEVLAEMTAVLSQ